MWSIGELKSNSKIAMKRFYWVAFAVCLVYGILSGGLGGGISYYNGYNSSSNGTLQGSDYTSPYGSTMIENEYRDILEGMQSNDVLLFTGIVVLIVLLVYLVITVLATCYSVFVVTPLTVGYHRYFVMARGFDNINFGVLFSNFRAGRYMSSVRLGWAKTWRLTLWSLLLIIPGIIKSYEYCMAEYIIAENPDIDAKRALQLSKAMTNGEKWHIFCMQLSFIGWYLLGCLCCGVGVFFVEPYYQATMAELYTVLRSKAFANGDTKASELIGFDPASV